MLICLAVIPPMPVEKKQSSRLKPGFRDYIEVFQNKRFFFIYGTMALWGLAEAALSFYVLHLQKYGYNSRHIGVLLALTMAGEACGFFLTVRLLKYTEPGNVIILSFISQIIRSGSLALVLPMPALAVCQFIGGFSMPFIWASITHLVNSTFSAKVGNVAQSLKVIANNGIAQLFGVPLCGFMYQYISSRFIFWFIVGISIIYIVGYGINRMVRLDNGFR
jgi:predicted MFS family arabinose efflux permease